MQPGSLRGTDRLGRCKDVVFREMGECIHVFWVRVPHFITGTAPDRTYPLVHAHVHAASELADPRLCSGPVPTTTKWINDSLDCVVRLSATALAGRPLEAVATTVEPAVIEGTRKRVGHAAAELVEWAACSFCHGKQSREANQRHQADLWEQPETDALEHIIHSLTLLGMTYDLEVADSSLHGRMDGDAGYVQVVAIRGETYEDCRLHYDRTVPKLGSDLVLVIARDRDNLVPAPEEFQRVYEAGGGRGLKFLAYQTLVTCCRITEDKDALRRSLDDILPTDQRII